MTPEELKSGITLFYRSELLAQILEKSQLMNLKAGKVLMEPGQFIKTIPIVLDGSIKVSRMDDEGQELFLYFLDAGETCALSLTCCSASKASEIKAVVEEDATIIAIPITAIDQFSNDFKQWKDFVSNTYQNRFQEMLVALDAVAFKRMDERLMGYIVKKMKQLKTNELHTTHQEIANELTTSREVVSRLLKQLEKRNG